MTAASPRLGSRPARWTAVIPLPVNDRLTGSLARYFCSGHCSPSATGRTLLLLYQATGPGRGIGALHAFWILFLS